MPGPPTVPDEVAVEGLGRRERLRLGALKRSRAVDRRADDAAPVVRLQVLAPVAHRPWL